MEHIPTGDKIRDGLDIAIGETIDYFLTFNAFDSFAPYLSNKKMTHEHPFFNQIRVYPKGSFTSEEYKTMSHLSKFYRSRIAYNPKNIDNFFWSIGEAQRGERTFDMMACNPLDTTDQITIEEYLLLDEKISMIIFTNIEISNKADYFDGIDVLFDMIGVK